MEKKDLHDTEKKDLHDTEKKDLPDTDPNDLPDTEKKDLPDTDPKDLPDTDSKNLPNIEKKDLPNIEKKDLPNIENIVLSGAGHGVYSYIGAFSVLLENKYIKIENIKSIYGTSAGGYIGILLLLDIEWNIIIDYFIERPWNELFIYDTLSILNLVNTTGLWDSSIIKKSIEPLFALKEMNIDITLLEFYEMTKVELYLFTTQLNNFNTLKLSYKTHPDMTLVNAIHMSCAVPFLWKPILYNNKYYIDGGLSSQYPINHILNENIDKDTIFGINALGDRIMEKDENKDDVNEKNSSYINIIKILQYLIFNPILKLLVGYTNTIYNQLNIYSCGNFTAENIKNTLHSQERRESLINQSKIEASLFLENKYNISL